MLPYRKTSEKGIALCCICVCLSQPHLFFSLHIRTVYCLETKGVKQLTIVGVMTDSKLEAQCTRQRSAEAGKD